MSSTESAPSIPERATVLVVGGGPGGSYASSVLAREGVDVVLLEAQKFPRYHIGESMLPSFRHYLRFIGLEDEFLERGFTKKPGACFKLNQGAKEAYTDFTTLGPDRVTWNVVRSESDNMLFRHAGKQGAKTFDETRVNSLDFANPDDATSRPIRAHWTNKAGASGSTEFDWLIDASGRNGIMCTKYLKNRTYREGLRNVAVWGYWTGTRKYLEGTKRENSPWFEAMSDESGWVWYIPLHDGTTSIGVVMHLDTSARKKKEYPGGSPSLTEHYLEQVKLAPGVIDLIGTGEMVPGSVKSAADYSYFADRYSGDHYRIVGDAAAFVDPFFSSGVHLALTGALSAASTILASSKGQLPEEDAQKWHDSKIGICHTRFLLVVLSAYQQMQHQNKAVLADINEDNFDRAFDMFLPVIQGVSDTKKKVSDTDLQGMIDFCIHLFEPTVEVQHKEVAQKYKPDLLSIAGPVLGPGDYDKVVDPEDESAKQVLSRMNALKILRNDTSCDSFGTEPIDGFVVQMERGKLGLVKV